MVTNIIQTNNTIANIIAVGIDVILSHFIPNNFNHGDIAYFPP